MSIKTAIGSFLRCTGINLMLVLAAAVADIILYALMPRFASRVLTIICFAVAGIFSAVCCFGSGTEGITKELKGRAARYLLLCIIVICILLFIVIAPLSGQDYNWPVKFFAMAQFTTGIFLWKNNVYDGNETPARNRTS